jgi:hypothetical protein
MRVLREFEGNRLAKDSQVRAYQELLPVVRSATRSGTGQLEMELKESLVGQEGVAA